MEDSIYQQACLGFSFLIFFSLIFGLLSAGFEAFTIVGFLGSFISLIGLSAIAILQNLGFPFFAMAVALLVLPLYLQHLGEKRDFERREECEKRAKELFPNAPPKALEIVEKMIYGGSDVSSLSWDGDILFSKDGENEKILYSKSIAKKPPKGKIYATEMTLIDDLIKEHGIALSETIKHYIAMMVRFGWDMDSTTSDGGFLGINLSRNQETMTVKLPCQPLEPKIPTQSAFPDPDASAKVEASE